MALGEVGLKKFHKKIFQKNIWPGIEEREKKIIDPSLRTSAMIAASSAVVIVQKLLEQILQLCFLNTNTQRAQSARAAITQTLKKLSLNRPGIRAQESGLFVPGPGNGLAQALHYLNFRQGLNM